MAFPLPFQQWPAVGQRWPLYNRSSSLAEGLVGWWPFLDSVERETIRNVVDGHNAVFPGGTSNPTWVFDTQQGWAINLDGSDDYIEIANSPRLDVTSAYTLAVWIYPTTISSFRPIWCRGEADADDIEVYLTATGLTLLHNRGNGGTATFKTGITNPSANAWTHLVITYNTVDLWRVFYNGIENTSGVVSGGSGQPPLDTDKLWRLGWDEHSVFSTTDHFVGRMTNAGIWNRSITPAEIKRFLDLELYEIPRRLWAFAPPAAGTSEGPLMGGRLLRGGTLVKQGILVR